MEKQKCTIFFNFVLTVLFEISKIILLLHFIFLRKVFFQRCFHLFIFFSIWDKYIYSLHVLQFFCVDCINFYGLNCPSILMIQLLFVHSFEIILFTSTWFVLTIVHH